jgi:hypothetical protein
MLLCLYSIRHTADRNQGTRGIATSRRVLLPSVHVEPVYFYTSMLKMRHMLSGILKKYNKEKEQNGNI